jgi:hypothetical protein
VPIVNLMSQLKDADLRPHGGRFTTEEHTFRGRSRASLFVPPESRLTFTLLIPHRARLQFQAAIPDTDRDSSVAFRVGISDDRIYRTLVERTITSADTAAIGWTPVVADLSFFAGRQLSLFFRPDERRWRIILGTHSVSGAPSGAYLGEPTIESDVEAAREYVKRRASRTY